jgi:plasmid stabilization system protein ParE
MKLKITQGFKNKLNDQVTYIAQDKPGAARKFKEDILQKIEAIPEMPFKNRKSIFFDREDIRDLVFKGYVLVYKVNVEKSEIELFGFVKYLQDPT